MALFTQADLKAQIPDLTQLLALDDDSNGVADAGVFDSILAEATNWINGYLEQAGVALADPPPARLKFLGVKYAEYCLWRRRGGAERVKDLYEQWIGPGMKWLEKLATGAELLAPPPAPTSESAPAEAITGPAKSYPSNGAMMV